VKLEKRTVFVPPLRDQTARSTLHYLLHFPKFYSSLDVTKTSASVFEPAVQSHSLSTSLVYLNEIQSLQRTHCVSITQTNL
jgi:hypothetical protein